MIISGFQPLSLLDYPGVISSIVFTQGCIFRCAYCHNPELVATKAAPEVKSIDESMIFEYLKRRKDMIEGVVITGGEPTLHPDLPEFLKKLKQLGVLVKLDTNGIHPRVVEFLLEEKLVNFIAMDLKHVWNRYSEVTNIDQAQTIKNCQHTFDIIQKSGIPHEFRTTVYSALHSADDLKNIAAQLQNDEHYALQAIRYEKTLVPDLARTAQLDLEAVAQEIRTQNPTLHIEVRA